MKVTTEKPKKLIYDLPKEIEYSKDGKFIKTKKLYIKEFVYGELRELNEKLDDFLDEFETCKQKGQIVSLAESVETMEAISKMIEIEAKNSNKTKDELKAEFETTSEKVANDIEARSLQNLNLAKRGGLSMKYLKKTLLPFLTNYIYCNEEMTITIKESNFNKLGLVQRGLVDFFLVGGLLPCYISLNIK